MFSAVVALAWANSPWRDSYEGLWHILLGVKVGDFHFERDMHFWINDGLMTIFFFVVGLEIRREIHAGELSDVRRAALPVAAAVGGMLVPALIFFALNSGRTSAIGWAIPMATDIAFAVGALALLGKRVAPALRILLLALAVIDDVGAIIVIALFYSTDSSALGFAILGVGILVILMLQILGVRSPLAYIAPGIAIWSGAYLGGIHPTLAGVIVGFMTPVRTWYGAEGLIDQMEAKVLTLRTDGVPEQRDLLPHLDRLRVANREAVSPVERLQYQLHGWVAFGIMPLFAFANAGVPMTEISIREDALWVFLGVTIGLMVGKPVGILALSWLATRFNAAALPRSVRWSHVSVVGIVGGIGFTMAIFIAQLAFPAGALLETAKLAILCGSGLAAILSVFAGCRFLKNDEGQGGAKTAEEAESSTLN
jgi:NhaA family Na+:H+ antiporter